MMQPAGYGTQQTYADPALGGAATGKKKTRAGIRCTTRESAMSSTLLLMRWLVEAMGFAAVIVAWVFSYGYENVVLGIISIFMIGLLILSDLPGMNESIGWARTSTIWFTRTYFRQAAYLAVLAITLARSYGSNTVGNIGIAYSAVSYTVATAVITGVVAAIHFALWLFYFRKHGNPEVHQVDTAHTTLSLPTTMAYSSPYQSANVQPVYTEQPVQVPVERTVSITPTANLQAVGVREGTPVPQNTARSMYASDGVVPLSQPGGVPADVLAV